MLIQFEDRTSDSPFVERVWRSHSEAAGTFSSMAACHWEIVVAKHEGRTSLIVRGPETRATTADCPAEGEWLAIRFKLGTYMPLLSPSELRDRNDVVLPDASTNSFWLNSSAWEYPDFENAETFVKRLVNRGLIVADPLVSSMINERTRTASTRTSQRRFQRVTGMSRTGIEQIQRARRATLLLKEGHSIPDVVFSAGYYDQAHLTRSLNRFVGQTPREIARGERQLSFLYNTDLS